MTSLKQLVIAELISVLEELEITGIVPGLDVPADPLHGDYATNVAFVASKKLGKSPIEVAADIKTKLDGRKSGMIEKIDVLKPGFINFWLSKDFLLSRLEEYADDPQKNFVQFGHGKSAIVEYSSPNIAKPFTVGHLRSTIIGDAVANLLAASGWKVHRDNHIGDWGTQFGKQIYAIKAWGDEEAIEKSEQPVKLLVDLYVKFHDEAEKDPSIEDDARAWFKKLEEGDSEAKRLWKKCIDWSWKEFEGIYKELGVSFTENGGRGFGESFFEDKMTAVVKELDEKGLLQEGEQGAKLVFFEKDKYPPLMILKKDGSTLYATRDLATDKFRLNEYGTDVLVINEVGAEQALYFKQLYEVERMLGWYTAGQRVHIKHGLYRFKDQKMSTRKGNTIWLEDVLEEAKKRAFQLSKREFPYHAEAAKSYGTDDIQINKHSESAKKSLNTGEIMTVAAQVGIGALKWNDLKRNPEQDIVFEWDDILNMQGNSGPYMQYAYARTQSILQKSKEQREKSKENSELRIKNLKLEIEERDLARLIIRYSDVVADAAVRYAPHVVAIYLFELAQAFSLFYQKHQILKEEGAVREFRLLLTKATGEVLKSGLSLLGIAAPQKM